MAEARTLDPAEQAIADSKAAYSQFLDTANAEVFAPAEQARSQSINSVADAYNQATQQLGQRLSTAAQQAAGVTPPAAAPATARPRTADGRFIPVTPQAAAQPQSATTSPPAPAAIPGPPTAASPATATPSAGQPTPSVAPADPFADVPAADAFDNPARLPRGNDWRRLHAKTDHFVEQAKTLQQQIEQLKTAQSAPAAPPKELTTQLATLQQERDALAAHLEAVAVERSPRFEAMFKPREDAAKLAAAQAAGPHADRVRELLKLGDSAYRNSQINEILKELEPGSLEANKLMMAVANLDSLANEKSAMAARSQDLYKQWRSEEQQNESRAMQQRQAAVSTTFEDTIKEWRAAGAEINDADVALAKDVFTGNRTIQDIARAAMWVAAGPKAAAQALSLQQQLDAANAELNKLRGIQPGNAPNNGNSAIPHMDNNSTEVPVRQGMYSEGIIQEAIRQGLPWR